MTLIALNKGKLSKILMLYRVYSNKRRDDYLIFCVSGAALIQERRLI